MRPPSTRMVMFGFAGVPVPSMIATWASNKAGSAASAMPVNADKASDARHVIRNFADIQLPLDRAAGPHEVAPGGLPTNSRTRWHPVNHPPHCALKQQNGRGKTEERQRQRRC